MDEMTGERQATVPSLPAPQQDVFCHDCVFYAPRQRRFEHRCGHPRAVQEVKTYERLVKRYVEPEEKNANNDCADFEARTCWELPVKVPLVLGFTFLAGIVALLFWFFPWLFGR